MGVLEDLSLGGVVFQLLFLLVGLAIGLKIDRVTEVLRAGKHMGNGETYARFRYVGPAQ